MRLNPGEVFWHPNGRIYTNLGDKFDVNFFNLDHMQQVRNLYRKVGNMRPVPGSIYFTTENIDKCKERFRHLVTAIVAVEDRVGRTA